MTTANLKMITLLVVSNNTAHYQLLHNVFDTYVERVHITTTLDTALDLFQTEHPEVIMIDSTLPPTDTWLLYPITPIVWG